MMLFAQPIAVVRLAMSREEKADKRVRGGAGSGLKRLGIPVNGKRTFS